MMMQYKQKNPKKTGIPKYQSIEHKKKSKNHNLFLLFVWSSTSEDKRNSKQIKKL
jgi:hypothetical protein